jgi:hypothetical protein
MKALVFDLMDEVWDAGDAVVVKNGGKEERILLSEIKNVNYSSLTNPQRITLSLRKPCRWGAEVSFTPPIRFLPFRKNPIVQDLIERIDTQRRT